MSFVQEIYEAELVLMSSQEVYYDVTVTLHIKAFILRRFIRYLTEFQPSLTQHNGMDTIKLNLLNWTNCVRVRHVRGKSHREIHFLYLSNWDIYRILKTCCSLSVLFSTKCRSFHNFITFFQVLSNSVMTSWNGLNILCLYKRML